jgi:murein DD-endopeptidase MepM/ murein hydrolase activator NlpD
MKKDRKHVLIDYIIQTTFTLMRGKGNLLSPPALCPGRGMPDGKYYIQAALINPDNLHFQEMVLSQKGDNILFRQWTFKRESGWDVLNLEKNKKKVFLVDITGELEDLARRLVLMMRLFAPPGIYYEGETERLGRELGLPEIPLDSSGALGHFWRRFRELSLRPSVYMPVILASLLLILLVGGIYTFRIGGINRRIDGSVADYIASLERRLENLHDFRAVAEQELETLKDRREAEQEDLRFNKQNAYVNVLRLAEELPLAQPSRREAYRLVASNIQDAVSYGEIIYEMSRMPGSEYQARVFLSTNKKNITPLGRFEPAFSGMAYPVNLAGAPNDGLGFRITDGYMERRADPLGRGGSSPHLAVDIVNVANINYVGYNGEIVRTGSEEGNVVAAYSGRVKSVGFTEDFGWYAEIEHPLTQEVAVRFSQASGWATFYAHMASQPQVAAGDWVEKGATLGLIGSTGLSTGPHLHFELKVFMPGGRYWDAAAGNYNKIEPFPRLKAGS